MKSTKLDVMVYGDIEDEEVRELVYNYLSNIFSDSRVSDVDVTLPEHKPRRVVGRRLV